MVTNTLTYNSKQYTYLQSKNNTLTYNLKTIHLLTINMLYKTIHLLTKNNTLTYNLTW